MIFNVNESSNVREVAPSPYELGVVGAFRHMAECEHNYNALMQAAGISELKYYTETGKDLWVNEAGSLSGFIAKAKAFVKSAWEKIKAMFKKLWMYVDQVTASDKDFVKKYQKQILMAKKDLEFEGYAFAALDDAIAECTENPQNSIDRANANRKEVESLDSDKLADYIEKEFYGNESEADFWKEIHDGLFGEKETVKFNPADQIKFISGSEENIKALKKAESGLEKAFNKLVKDLEKEEKDTMNSIKADNSQEANDEASKKAKGVANFITVVKTFSSIEMRMVGVCIDAVKKRRAQAKSVCIKAISKTAKDNKKNESAAYGNLFAGVTMI